VKRWLVLLALLAACKDKQVPFKPPPKDDAAVRPIDATEADASVAAVKQAAMKIVVGENWSCAVLADKTVRCWGRNTEGQLGSGAATDSAKPVQPKVVGVVDLVVGTAHTCALLDDTSVACWGGLNYGRKDSLPVPAGVPGVAKVKRIFALGGASCAGLVNGELVCWGDVDLQGHPRLERSAIEHRVPTPVEGVHGVAMLTANGALLENGDVMFWGTSGVPQKTALTGVTEIAASGEEVCGLRGDGSVACVGPTTVCAANAPKPPPPPPKKPPPKKPAAKKTASKKTAKKPAAKKPTAPEPKPEPEKPKELPIEVLALPPAKHLAFDVGLCVVTKSGALVCLAPSDGCKQDSPWPGLANVDVVTGHCALVHGGAVKCWGVDRKSRVVAAIGGAANSRMLVVSSSHACALRSDHEIVCWGSNKYGALGSGQIDDDPHREGHVVAF
jgi:hypothetical protein